MSKNLRKRIICLALSLSAVTGFSQALYAESPSADTLKISFSDESMAALKESGSTIKTNASADGEIVNSDISHDGDGAAFKAAHIAGKGYNSVENAVRLDLGTPLSGSEAYTISAWFYIPSEGNTEGKDELIGPGVLINGNSGDTAFKYPTSVEEAGRITYDEWINVAFRTTVLGTTINYIDFRFYTNDAETHPEVWYLDDISVGITADKPTILTKELDYGTLTVPYEQELSAMGNKPISWSITDGSLPAGLELTSGGIIKGTPTETAVEAAFTIEAANEFGTDNVEYKLTVYETDSVFTLAEAKGKELGNSNPLYTQRYGADPWAMEYDGRLYLYMTNDTYEYDSEGNIAANSYGTIRHINVISSADMVNWTDHGSIPVAGIDGVAKWANNSWAPCAVWRNENGEDKFYLYFTNGGGGIGVLVGDSPIGPWSDPNGRALVSHSTPNCSGNLVPWCFDPAVFIDDDGTGYLYFGGGITDLDADNPKSGRVVKLKDNLTEIDGTPEEIAPPYFFEALAMHKYNGKYYLTYCANFQSPGAILGVQPGSGNIAYMMSDNPMGPFEYVGEVLNNPGSFGFGGGNNHQCVFKFLDEWYIAYHTSLVYMDVSNGGTGYRSTSIDRLTFNDDGTMNPVKGTKTGISRLKGLNPYENIEAETIAWSGGIETVMKDPTQMSSTNLFVSGIKNGSWLSVAGAEIGDTTPGAFWVKAAGKRGGIIELRTGSPDPDSPDSSLIGTLSVDAGDGTAWTEISVPLTADITGTHDLYLVFKGDVNKTELFDLDSWRLLRKSTTSDWGGAPDSTDETEENSSRLVLLITIGGAIVSSVIGYLLTRKKKEKK